VTQSRKDLRVRAGPKQITVCLSLYRRDDDLRAVAQEFIDRLGRDAIAELFEQAEIAVGMGDHESAETWREIARAAEGLLN
jgi:hypothetical protein